MNWRALAVGTILCATPITAQPARFEVVSIKPSSRDLYPPNIDEKDPCSSALPRLTGRQLASGTTTLYALIALAHNPWKQSGGACTFAIRSSLISGGPAWVKSQRHAIQMLLPEGFEIAAWDRLLTTGEASGMQQLLHDAAGALQRLAQRLGTAAQRPVLDRTGIAGEFDFILEFDDSGFLRPTLVTAIQEQLGLKLQSARAPVEILVVERAEMPTPN